MLHTYFFLEQFTNPTDPGLKRSIHEVNKTTLKRSIFDEPAKRFSVLTSLYLYQITTRLPAVCVKLHDSVCAFQTGHDLACEIEHSDLCTGTGVEAEVEHGRSSCGIRINLRIQRCSCLLKWLSTHRGFGSFSLACSWCGRCNETGVKRPRVHPRPRAAEPQ